MCKNRPFNVQKHSGTHQPKVKKIETQYLNMRVDRQTQLLADLLVWSSEFASTGFEKAFHPEKTVSFAANNHAIPIVMVSLYMAFCYFGQKIMANRPAFNLRLPLAGWNAFLCLFSFLGMCRTVRKNTICKLPNPLI